jgi:Tol biopolymer transport system component
MTLSHMKHLTPKNIHNWKMGKLLSLLIFLVVFISACSPPKNATLLNKPDWPPASDLIWSPIGDELAITGLGGNNQSAISVLNVKTKKMRMLLKQDYGYIDAMSWTADGKKLAFFAYSSNDFKSGTWLADPSGVEPPRFLLNDPVVAWSPVSEMVIGRKDNATQQTSLYLHDIETNTETIIFSGIGGINGSVLWSSNGSKLVFLLEKDLRKRGIYVFDAIEKKTIQVTPDGDIRSPSFSPDGKMIVYTKADPTNNLPTDYLHIMKSNGSCDVEVPGHFDVYSPAWSPDGKTIAYIGKTDGGIYLLDLVGAFGEDIVEKGLLPCP